jgi:hypothetical protein
MRSYTVTYTGQGISLNMFYAGGHWSERSKVKTKFKNIFTILFLQAKIKPLEQFTISLVYNSRLDPDNVVAMAKVYCDSLKGRYIKDDTKKYYKGLSISPDETLPHNTYVFTITEV